MSISNLLLPNDYSIICNSIDPSGLVKGSVIAGTFNWNRGEDTQNNNEIIIPPSADVEIASVSLTTQFDNYKFFYSVNFSIQQNSGFVLDSFFGWNIYYTINNGPYIFFNDDRIYYWEYASQIINVSFSFMDNSNQPAVQGDEVSFFLFISNDDTTTIRLLPYHTFSVIEFQEY